MKIKFVSYDGKYPNLCSGTLVLEIDGEEESFSNCLYAEDSDFGDNATWSFEVDEYNNPKSIDFGEMEVIYIEHLLNKHVERPHCGGCS